MSSGILGYVVSAAQIVAGVILTATGNAAVGIPLILSGTAQGASMILAPRIPSGRGGLERSPTYGFDGATNTAFEGAPKMVVFGEEQISPAYVSFRTEQDGTKQFGYALLHAGSGGPYGIESISGFELNDQPIENFDDVEVEYVKGTSGQSAIKGFTKASTPWVDGSDLVKGEEWIYTTHRAVSEVRIVIACPGGLRYIDKGGKMTSTDFVMSVWWRNRGDTEWTRYTSDEPEKKDGKWHQDDDSSSNWAIFGKTLSVFRAVFPIAWSDENVREIKVVAAKESDQHAQRDAIVQRVEEITEDDDAHAGDVLIGIKFLAQEQLAGALPKVTCICRGWKFSLPGDTGWDTGSATPTWTRNPARIAMIFLLNDADLCGDWIGPSPTYEEVDYAGSWATVAARCDANAASSGDHHEARWQLDYVVDVKASASEHLAAILATFRAQIIEYEGSLHLVQDVAASSSATFDSRIAGSDANRPILSLPSVSEDLPGAPDLLEQEIPAEERATHVRLQYRDRDDRYKPKFTEELIRSDWSTGDPIVRHEAFLVGVTRETQAIREARAVLLRSELRGLVTEFGVGLGDLDLIPMDVITLYADYPTWSGKLFQVLSISYGMDGRGRVRALEYDANAYVDTTDKLPTRPAWLSRQTALARARKIPKGASNVKVKELKGSFHLQVSWGAQPDTALRLWRVYLSESEDDKGDLITEVQPTGRTCIIRDVTEATYWIRVLAVSVAGTEESIRRSQASVRYVATRTRTTPSALTNAGGGKVDNSQATKVIVDPPPATDPPVKVEVIKGASAETGQLVGTVEVERSGITGEQGERQASVSIPAQPGRRTGGGTETLSIRAVDAEGKKAGAATQVTVPHLDLANHYAVEIASIVGSTLSGISSPAGTDGWEADATDGARLREIPTIANLDSDWGTVGSGLFASQPVGAFYVTEETVTFDEYDLGTTYAFALECYDEAQRKSAAGAWSSIDVRRLKHWKLFPSGDPEIRPNDLGPEWLMRMVTIEGKPLRPLPPTKWEWRAGTSSPLSGDWLPYVPGLQVYARYVQVRMTLRDPMGQHQTICPRAYVRAWVANDTRAIPKSGSDFTDAELGDFLLPAGAKDIGVRTDAGNESIQINIGGAVFKVDVTAVV